MMKRLAFLLALLGSLPAQAQYVTNPPGSGTFLLTSGANATTATLDAIATSAGQTGGLKPTDAPTFAGETLTGALTSTVSTGTAPLVVSSTTNVANLNASSLGGATFAAPGAIGGGTPAAGTFTSLTDNTMTSGSVLFAGTGGLVSQDNANFAYDSTHARLGVAVSGADLVDRLMVAADLTGGIITDSGNAQFMITGSTNKNKRLGFVYDTTGNFGAIQAAIAGVTVSPIAINPTGGNVGIDTAAPQATLHDNGTFLLGSASAWTASSGEFGMTKITDPASAPGAGVVKLTAEAGTNAGTCKIVARAGTSATGVTLLDNIGGSC